MHAKRRRGKAVSAFMFLFPFLLCTVVVVEIMMRSHMPIVARNPKSEILKPT